MVLSDQLPKNYDFAEVEERWRKTWRDEDNYFDKTSKKPQFVIDTPRRTRRGTSISGMH